MRAVTLALFSAAVMAMSARPAAAIAIVCSTYCNDGNSLNPGTAPSQPPVPNIGEQTFGDSTPGGTIVTFNPGDTYEDIFDASSTIWVLNFGLQTPDTFFVQIYNPGYESGDINPPGGYLYFVPDGSPYDVFVTLTQPDPPGATEVTNGIPLDAPPSPTPLPATLPLFAGGLSLVGFLARRKRKAAAAITD
jgi:hypothetical protein